MRNFSLSQVRKAELSDVHADLRNEIQSFIEDSETTGLTFCRFLMQPLFKEHPDFYINSQEGFYYYTIILGKVKYNESYLYDYDSLPRGTLIVTIVGLDEHNSCDFSWDIELPNFTFEYQGIKYRLGQFHKSYYTVEPI